MEVYFEGADKRDEMPRYPVECHKKSDYKPGMTAYPHWHYYSELVYVNAGSFDFVVNGSGVTLFEGDTLYINPKQVHAATCPVGVKPCLTVLKFDPALLKSSIENYIETKYLSPFSLPIFNPNAVFRAVSQADDTRRQLDEILRITDEKRFGYEYATHNCICQIIMQFITATYESCGEKVFAYCLNEQELDELSPAIEHINQEFRGEIDTETVVDLCHLSYSNFAVKFKRLTGKSLREYINFTRVSYSQQLLGETVLSVTEIAALCGFNDASYFIRTFKKYTGMSPNQVRSKQKNPLA